MNTPATAIVVAVSAEGHEAAVAFAVSEARRTHRPVHLVHVLDNVQAYSYVHHPSSGLLDAGKATLDDAATFAEELAGQDVPVTSELVDSGWLVDELVRHTDGAGLLVLQHRAMSRARRVFTGSVVLSVAARAHVGVVAVPGHWQPEAAVKGFVTAGVQEAVDAPALLRAGFEEARSRGAELVVLHAWWLNSGYDATVVDDAMREEYSAQFQQELKPVLRPLRDEFPDVPVNVLVRHAPPAEAVLDAAETSDLVVIGRRHHLLPIGSHLGPVARASLGRSTAPVLVTPESPSSES